MKLEVHGEMADSRSGAGDLQGEFGTPGHMREQDSYPRLPESRSKDSEDNLNNSHWPKMGQPPGHQ